MRLRFAPSPTGQLHVGNARTALFNWLLARGQGGTFIVRIEDTDVERSTRESEQAILDDLHWLGLEWTEGVEAGGEHGPYRQTERLHIYRAHAVELLSSGKAYHCFCSAEQLEADRQDALKAGRPPKYTGRCRAVSRDEARKRIENGEPAVIRFRVPGQPAASRSTTSSAVQLSFDMDVIGDSVLLRSNGVPAYNFAVVIDDALMEITHVVRGEDHISNTPRQVLLYEAFGWTPPMFAHVSLVLGPDHAPLSKRHGATSVKEFRDRGYLPEALTNYLALIGWSPGEGEELLPIEELARRFRLENVGHSAGVFDVGEAGVGEPALPEDGRSSPARGARRCRICSRPDGSRHATPADLEFLDAGRPGGGRVGRSARAGAGAAGVSVRLLRGTGAGDSADSRRGAAARAR